MLSVAKWQPIYPGLNVLTNFYVHRTRAYGYSQHNLQTSSVVWLSVLTREHGSLMDKTKVMMWAIVTSGTEQKI